MTVAPLALQVDGLRFAHAGRPLWDGWSHRWSPGVSLVLGGDGAGKSTLLRLLAGTERAQGGRITLTGVDAGQGAPYRAQVAWTDPRQPGLPAQDGLTPARWWQTLPARYPGWRAADLQTHIDGWALAPHQDKPFHALSTGTQRKVFMAAALASGAPLTLIDEPVAGLDKASVAYLQSALDALAVQRERIILVAHYEPLAGVRWQDVVQLPD